MYKDLVKELQDSAEWADRLAVLMGRTDGDTHAPIMRKAADAIEELQSRAKVLEKVADKWCEAVPKWIPVTERLPKEDETVMTWGKQEVVLLDWLHDNQWCCFGEATYWMPLPEPPKEEH